LPVARATVVERRLRSSLRASPSTQQRSAPAWWPARLCM